MSVQRRQIPITSPCPITLDRSGAGPQDRALFCSQCSKDVHLLSNMTESEARDLMSRRAGDDICVSYAVRDDGRIRFRPEPALVPATALVRRGLSMAASIGAAAWLAGCTPHGDENAVRTDEATQVDGGIRARPIEPPPVVEPKPKPEPERKSKRRHFAGGLMAEPIDPL